MTAKTPQLAAHETWFAPGAPVVELVYHGGGHYSATDTIVRQVTPTQIITATGLRFWRSRCGRQLVGQTEQRNAGMRPALTRIVPPDNPYVMRLRGSSREG